MQRLLSFIRTRCAPLVGYRLALRSCVFVLGIALANSRPATAQAPTPALQAKALRGEATRLFRAKQYGQACPKFEAAVRLAPNDPEFLGDLALCEYRLGHEDVARELNRKVITLEASTARLGD